MSKLSDVLSGTRAPQQRVEQAHSQPVATRSSGIVIPGAIPSGNQPPAVLPVSSTGVSMPHAASIVVGQPISPVISAPTTVVSNPTAIIPQRAPAPNDMLAALANTEVQLTNDVADWPELAYANIDVNDVKGQLQILLLDLQQNMMSNDIGQHLRRIMEFIGANPAMADTLLPDEFGLIVDALKSSHGVVISAKTENRAKKQSKSKVTNELLDAFKDIEF